jgi:hypothetical protein
MLAGLRGRRHLPKQGSTQSQECRRSRSDHKTRASARAEATIKQEEIVRRWLLAFIIIALVALVAGYYTFGGADMGR